ncbi:MAG: hypothetical protein JO189_29530 [Deltaproteobacteria bacterium]|nr:hypothetical protein [Deltaproteobacteria bacterium]
MLIEPDFADTPWKNASCRSPTSCGSQYYDVHYAEGWEEWRRLFGALLETIAVLRPPSG